MFFGVEASFLNVFVKVLRYQRAMINDLLQATSLSLSRSLSLSLEKMEALI